MFGRGSNKGTTKKSEDVKKSAGKVLDTKKDTATRAKVGMLVLHHHQHQLVMLVLVFVQQVVVLVVLVLLQ